MWAVAGSAFCFSHCPERAGDRASARQLGGHNRKRRTDGPVVPVRLRSVGEIRTVLERTCGEMAATEAGLSKTRGLVALLTLAWALVEGSETESRLCRIEAALAKQDRENAEGGGFG